MIEPMREVNHRLEQRRCHDHAERGRTEPPEQPDGHHVVPQLGGEAGEEVAQPQACQPEAVGEARTEAVDQLAGERAGEPVCQHVDGIGERDVGAREMPRPFCTGSRKTANVSGTPRATRFMAKVRVTSAQRNAATACSPA